MLYQPAIHQATDLPSVWKQSAAVLTLQSLSVLVETHVHVYMFNACVLASLYFVVL